VVQLTGSVGAYRGKPEMTLREPTQLALLVDPSATASPAPVPLQAVPLIIAAPSIDAALAAIDERLSALETRLGAIEQTFATQVEEARVNQSFRPTPVSQVRGLGIGVAPQAVRAALGRPREVRRGPDGGAVWSY